MFTLSKSILVNLNIFDLKNILLIQSFHLKNNDLN